MWNCGHARPETGRRTICFVVVLAAEKERVYKANFYFFNFNITTYRNFQRSVSVLLIYAILEVIFPASSPSLVKFSSFSVNKGKDSPLIGYD